MKDKNIYYKPDEWRDHISENYFEIVFIGYNKSNDFLILINNVDMDMNSEQQSYRFFEIRCIKPETAFKNGIFP